MRTKFWNRSGNGDKAAASSSTLSTDRTRFTSSSETQATISSNATSDISLLGQIAELQLQLLESVSALSNAKQEADVLLSEKAEILTQNGMLRREADKMTVELATLKEQHHMTSLELITVQGGLNHSKFSNLLYDAKINAQQDEIQQLRSKVAESKNFLTEAADAYLEAIRKTETLEGDLEMALDQGGPLMTENFTHYKSQSNRIEQLEAQCAEQTRLELEEKARYENELGLVQAALRIEQQAQYQSRVELANAENTIRSLHDQHNSATQSWLHESQLQHERLGEMREFRDTWDQLVGPTVTLRQFLGLKMLAETFRMSSMADQSESTLKVTLDETSKEMKLDDPLDLDDIARLTVDLETSLDGEPMKSFLRLEECAGCQKVKFLAPEDSSDRVSVTREFPAKFQEMECCKRSICFDCLPGRLLLSINAGWHISPDRYQWLGCPNPTCSTLIECEDPDELSSFLEQALGAEHDVVARYARANELRRFLQGMQPEPSMAALKYSAKLHEDLAQRGRMYNLFDQQCRVPELGMGGHIEASDIHWATVDAITEKVPIFMGFFRRKEESKECVICAEEYHEIDFETDDEWVGSCQGLEGKWVWDVLDFPSKLKLACDHDMETCRKCLERTLRTDLEQHGRAGCERLSCPQCSRRLEHREIQIYADPDTAEKQDRYRLLNLLSLEGDFRWCLREGCDNGEIFENDPGFRQIVCGECDFTMCFQHQTPWHEGLTCAQYDNQQAHGDPQHEETQRWLTTNTKQCPGAGCGVNIEKNSGCFHMTCGSCQFEFCWECLANWSLIYPGNGARHVPEGHNTGCWFLTGQFSPNQVAGNTLTAALRNRRVVGQ